MATAPRMPEKSFIIPIDGGCFVVAECHRHRGRITSFVVRLMLDLGNEDLAVVARYDTAHGVPHLDQLRPGGVWPPKSGWLYLTSTRLTSMRYRSFA